ncbi:aminopeptidase P family protein [Microcella alkaliphila]|uniref:Xaa-Pro aminopeptidase n=1 Tax=Microcella alkaliphila TaxID=279828 RepID=A0A0U5B4S3_9MICO|nr:aminopeptidase P family protein [Microcella alkaliphila]BAU30921.1 Xaa-Pro aminopeptidase [Microcella alkaliphila]
MNDDQIAGEPIPVTSRNRSTTPTSDSFRSYIRQGWAEVSVERGLLRDAAVFAQSRRARLSAAFEGKTVIIPAGLQAVRANDQYYTYRPHSGFAHLTAWGSDTVAGSILVLEPIVHGHRAILFFRPSSGHDSDEFYANNEVGELWTGRRPTLQQVADELGIDTQSLDEFEQALEMWDGEMVVLRDADLPVTSLVDRRRRSVSTRRDGELGMIPTDDDEHLAQVLSEMRLVKDAFEIAELRRAVAATQRGFDDVISQLRDCVGHDRGERLVEGVFYRRARVEGHGVGYETIVAAGPHACTLHWTRNDGPIRQGDLLLLDAGVEVDSLYTADITRTVPISGTFTDIQREVYDAVLEAADAAREAAKPGARFRDMHDAAMRVIAHHVSEWGLIPVSAEDALHGEAQHHRRFMIHGTGHHLGLDVHDCSRARQQVYLDGFLEPGMVFTIEPGLYFHEDDLSVPERFRGIGVRIEDDVLLTEHGCELLSADFPRTAREIERWMERA